MIQEIINRLRSLEITRAELNRVQESLLQERDLLLTKLERANLEKEEHEVVVTQLGQLGPSRGNSSARGLVVNPYLRALAVPATSCTSPLVNPYLRSATAPVAASGQ